jgi:hypothetical protein
MSCDTKATLQGLTNLQLLQTTKAQVLTVLAEITACPKPSYSIDGQSVSWSDYVAMLTKQVETLNELINQESPYILTSTAVT